MRPIKIAAWVATILGALWFIIKIIAASKINTHYGSPALSPPYVLGLLSACSLIPGVLWIIVLITKKNESVNRNNEDVTEVAGIKHEQTVDTMDNDGFSFTTLDSNKIDEIKAKICELQNSGVLSEAEAAEKIYQIDRKLKEEQKVKEELERKQKDKSSLDFLRDEGILTPEEYDNKITELFPIQETESTNQEDGTYYECVHCNHVEEFDFEFCPRCHKDDDGLTANEKIKSLKLNSQARDCSSINSTQDNPNRYIQHKTDKGIIELEPCIYFIGKKAFKDGKPAPDGRYKFGFLWYVEIRNGIVVKGKRGLLGLY